MDVTSLVVQGGSLGLLTVVIILIWKYISNRMVVEDSRMEQEQARLDKTLGFMQELSKSTTTQLSAQFKIWEELSTKTLNSLGRIHERLDSVDIKMEKLDCLEKQVKEIRKRDAV